MDAGAEALRPCEGGEAEQQGARKLGADARATRPNFLAVAAGHQLLGVEGRAAREQGRERCRSGPEAGVDRVGMIGIARRHGGEDQPAGRNDRLAGRRRRRGIGDMFEQIGAEDAGEAAARERCREGGIEDVARQIDAVARPDVAVDDLDAGSGQRSEQLACDVGLDDLAKAPRRSAQVEQRRYPVLGEEDLADPDGLDREQRQNPTSSRLRRVALPPELVVSVDVTRSVQKRGR